MTHRIAAALIALASLAGCSSSSATTDACASLGGTVDGTDSCLGYNNAWCLHATALCGDAYANCMAKSPRCDVLPYHGASVCKASLDPCVQGINALDCLDMTLSKVPAACTTWRAQFGP